MKDTQLVSLDDRLPYNLNSPQLKELFNCSDRRTIIKKLKEAEIPILDLGQEKVVLHKDIMKRVRCTHIHSTKEPPLLK